MHSKQKFMPQMQRVPRFAAEEATVFHQQSIDRDRISQVLDMLPFRIFPATTHEGKCNGLPGSTRLYRTTADKKIAMFS